MTAVAVSVSLFVLRFIWLWQQNQWLQKKWVKVAPHIIDTLLLASAIVLCFMLSQYPFQTPWLTAKVVGVIAYILCGLWTLKWAKNKSGKLVGFVLSMLSIAFTAHVAMSKQGMFFG